jgi:hypothetical protein
VATLGKHERSDQLLMIILLIFYARPAPLINIKNLNWSWLIALPNKVPPPLFIKCHFCKKEYKEAKELFKHLQQIHDCNFSVSKAIMDLTMETSYLQKRLN